MNGEGRDHTAAVESAIEAAGVTLYVGGAPDDPVMPYVALYSDAGRGLRASLDGATDHYVHTFQTSCVGVTMEQTTWLAEKIQGVLSGQTLTVSGWSCGPVAHIMAGITGKDYDAPTDVNTKYDQWRYYTTPSA